VSEERRGGGGSVLPPKWHGMPQETLFSNFWEKVEGEEGRVKLKQ